MRWFAVRRGFLKRLGAIIVKEVLQLRRDRLTFAMMFGMPIVQLLLFGYAIDTDPHRLPTAVIAADQSQITRTVLSALNNTGYMRFTHHLTSEDEANALLQQGEVQFVVTIPSDFTRRLVRGERAQILIDADATDPMAAANPLAAAGPSIAQALKRDFVGPLAGLRDRPDAVEVVVQRRYNPEGKSRLNIVPGLLAVILTMTMVMMTALAVTRERERGTMENLLAMPVRPIEVMIGKIVPYIAIGTVQVTVILLVARVLFDVAIQGSVPLLATGTALFITVNLAIGFTISTLTQNQLQAMQASFFMMLPSILLSGFMFPFRGMPVWAQWIGETLPATHFMRVVRGVMLKGAGFDDIATELAALLAMLLIVSLVAVSRYKVTLD
ncbi:ABC transporter permease [Reyranella sp. MMS21-HV4-11]|jgi:ABC-2 type transport system permease protein|uniref:ABC transporter permease n=1 Tax=Reyranella humidisoli TaxID=2849149 RepID=A0ABS6IRP0_9HYPH|nr:ABC transporter permease [Reyranella sp. MMS21-HV4-11]MBU8877256.1 ABC transporter permease [Reyranella sp. MMS21-HV4-11]